MSLSRLERACVPTGNSSRASVCVGEKPAAVGGVAGGRAHRPAHEHELEEDEPGQPRERRREGGVGAGAERRRHEDGNEPNLRRVRRGDGKRSAVRGAQEPRA